MISRTVCRRLISSFFVAAAISSACAASLWAYSPPVDQVGPLTVRIIGPETVTQIDTAVDIRVTLENRGDQPVSGSIRLGLIDGWQSQPAGPAAFTAAAKSTTGCDFRVMVAPEAYSAHYPIHAYATFAWQGQPRTAHPILVLETKLPARTQAAPALAWQPLRLTGDRTLALLQVPVRRAVVAVFGQPPQTMPVGWTGAAEGNRSSISFQNAQRPRRNNLNKLVLLVLIDSVITRACKMHKWLHGFAASTGLLAPRWMNACGDSGRRQNLVRLDGEESRPSRKLRVCLGRRSRPVFGN